VEQTHENREYLCRDYEQSAAAVLFLADMAHISGIV